MRRIKAILTVLTILMSALIIVDMGFNVMTIKAEAATLHVGSGPGNDSATIQSAIDLADPGDTIYVHSGEYNENFDGTDALKIGKTITLIGEDRNTTLINATGKTRGIQIESTDYVSISGFTVKGANFYNVRISSCNHCQITGNDISGLDITAYGIGLFSGQENLIEENNISGSYRGLKIGDNSRSNSIKNNTIISLNESILIDTSAHGNLIYNNNISGYSNLGIYIKESMNNLIENNWISGGIEGVRILDHSSALLLNNIISDNDIAVKVLDYSSATIVNCTLQNSESYDIKLGEGALGYADVTLINTSFDDDKIFFEDDGSTSSLTVQWYLQVEVVDESGAPVPNIIVQVRDKTNESFDERYVTNSNGYAKWIALTHYQQNRTVRIYHAPYNITAFNSTSFGYAAPEVTMNMNREITVIVHPDRDADGFLDEVDAFPDDSTQWIDSDSDGYGDNQTGNNPDAFPGDPTQWLDSDLDSYGDNKTGNNPDAFPYDSTQWLDSDGDGYGDNASGNDPDAFPSDETQWLDADGDGYGDNASGSNPDAFPTEPTQWNDRDGDDWGDNPSGNFSDAFPDNPNEWWDTDGDGVGDNSDFLPTIDNSIFFMVLGIVIIVIIIIFAILFLKRRKKPAQWEDEETE